MLQQSQRPNDREQRCMGSRVIKLPEDIALGHTGDQHHNADVWQWRLTASGWDDRAWAQPHKDEGIA